MEEGVILAWLKQPGDAVARGDELAEIETDKATVVYEADHAGILEIVADEGVPMPIGAVIGHLHPGDGASVAQPAAASSGGAMAVGPDASAVADTGSEEPARSQKLTSVQSLIAERMTFSRTSVPDFSLDCDIDMSEAMALYRGHKGSGDGSWSVNDLIVKACAHALRDFPLANASFRGTEFQLHPDINVGVAVATDDSLIVPTVTGADQRSLAEIAQITRELASKVRDGTITPADLDGATFTVSNLGMFGVRSFTAIINAPQAAILAAGQVERRPVVHADEIVPRELMSARLSCDHRVLYGAYAANFLARIRELLEQPAQLTDR
jgi:pyruvate dehydrogenase E2 component (dihydrolipoamide acetyltransferase)